MESYNLKDRTPTKRFGCHDWGPPQDWDDKSVVSEAVSFLSELLAMGVAGFRFDAAKHIRPEILKDVVENAVRSAQPAKKLLNYSEVLDHQPWICEEYLLSDDPVFTVTDYPRTFSLRGALAPDGDLRQFVSQQHSWWSWKSVCLADSHDSMEGNSYSFFDEREGTLAIGILLAIGCGTPLLYHSFLHQSIVKAGIHFYHSTYGNSASCASGSTAELLILQKGNNAFAIVNKKFDWVSMDAFEVDWLGEGKFRELQTQRNTSDRKFSKM